MDSIVPVPEELFISALKYLITFFNAIYRVGKHADPSTTTTTALFCLLWQNFCEINLILMFSN